MIKVNDEWYISSDKYCFMLLKKEVVDGKEVLEPQTYHTTLQGVIKSIIKRKIRLEDKDSFKELKKCLEDIYSEIEKCEDLNVNALRKEYYEQADARKESVKKNK